MLATPGLDRHAAYVAMSRHRDRVDLHYGQDDFSDQRALTRALSRDRGKDMAFDYPVSELLQRPPQVPSPFAGLKLKTSPVVTPEQDPFKQGVVRVARAAADILRTRKDRQEPLPHQAAELQNSATELEAIRPGARADLRSAFNADPALVDEAAKGRPQATIRAMALEAEMRTDPTRRADQFVARWSKLQRDSERAYQVGDVVRCKAIKTQMAGMAKSLERDPQLESMLAARKAQLGIKIETGRRLGAEMAFNHGMDWGRGRGLGR